MRRRATGLRAGVGFLLFLAGCSGMRAHVPKQPRSLPVEKVATAEVAVPRRGELPGLIGRLQWHSIQPKETLLDTARDSGLGFNEVADANPGVDEWIPATGTSVLVPSMWILPRSHYRGLVINVAEMRMYLYPAKTSPGDRVPVRTWPIGIGTEERNSPIGAFHVTAMDANPTWIVPDSIYKTMDPPRRRVVPPGPDNPLGTHRIRLSKGLYSIHGTDTPWSVGRLTTHGCIRLYPEDIPDLYKRLKPGARGELVYQPVKIGEADGRVFLEVHPDVYGQTGNLEKEALRLLKEAKLETRVDTELVHAVAKSPSGVPVDVSRGASFTQAGVLSVEPIETVAPARKPKPRSRAGL